MPCLHLNLPAEACCSLVVWNYRSVETALPHTHTFYELFWVESGEGCHWIHGERRLMKTGFLAFIRPEDSHTFSTAQEGGEVTFSNFACYPFIWERVWKQFLGNGPLFFAERDYLDREWMLDGAELERVRLLAADLYTGSLDPLTAEAFLMGLFSLLLNQKKRLNRALNASPWLAAACESIRIWPHFKEGVDAFVKLAGRSPEHVARECRRHFGKTPRDFVNEARLEYAAVQLCTSNHPILDIVFEAGFENVGHFYQLFRRRYGQSPRRYRLHHFAGGRELGIGAAAPGSSLAPPSAAVGHVFPRSPIRTS